MFLPTPSPLSFGIACSSHAICVSLHRISISFTCFIHNQSVFQLLIGGFHIQIVYLVKVLLVVCNHYQGLRHWVSFHGSCLRGDYHQARAKQEVESQLEQLSTESSSEAAAKTEEVFITRVNSKEVYTQALCEQLLKQQYVPCWLMSLKELVCHFF
jgi:hypothetical protein